MPVPLLREGEGLESPLLGLAVFAVIKLAGYVGAAALLNRSYPDRRRNLLAVGAARTALGIASGFAYGLILASVHPEGRLGFSPAAFYAGLIPVRLAEWWLLLWIFYRPLRDRRKGWKWAVLGTAWSFVLDLPAATGIFFTGWIGVC